MRAKIGIFTLLLLSVSVAVLFGELAVRYIVSAAPFDEPIIFFDYLTAKDAPLRYRLPPGNGNNSLGLHNREIAEKAEGQFRLLFLGDSLLYRGETTSGRMYTQVIEDNLNSMLRNNTKNIEVINAGVRGYTTYQELEFLKIYGLDMKPDHVILGFVFNDLYYKYLHRPTTYGWFGIEPRSRLTRIDTRQFPGSLFRNSHLAHVVAFALDRIAAVLTGRPNYEFERRWDFHLAWKPHAWPVTRQLIEEMRDLLAKSGIGLTVVVFPVMEQFDTKLREADENYLYYPNSRIREICADLGIPLFDLLESVEANGGRSLFGDYLHFSPRGNDVLAVALTNYLVENQAMWLDQARVRR